MTEPLFRSRIFAPAARAGACRRRVRAARGRHDKRHRRRSRLWDAPLAALYLRIVLGTIAAVGCGDRGHGGAHVDAEAGAAAGFRLRRLHPLSRVRSLRPRHWRARQRLRARHGWPVSLAVPTQSLCGDRRRVRWRFVEPRRRRYRPVARAPDDRRHPRSLVCRGAAFARFLRQPAASRIINLVFAATLVLTTALAMFG